MFLPRPFATTMRIAFAFTTVLSLVLVPYQVHAQDQLHVTLNRLLSEQHIGPKLPACNDADFVRRVYLDLLGRIPSASEARAFMESTSADKRAVLVDQLLEHPRYAEHMADVFDVMMMERRPDKHVKKDQWRAYLVASFQQNKPYHQLAGEILGADGADEQLRAASKFYLDRDLGVDILTRDVGRVFFGMDLECAQCHDHPLIGDYLQADYYGIYAFLSGNYLFQPDKKKPALIGEKLVGEAKFKSVFTSAEGMTRPRLPGETQLDEPVFAKGEEYQSAPDDKKKVRGVLKFSRRQKLGELVAAGTNRAFTRNIANRLWAHMMGQGLVYPVDLHHGDNPPSHPALLDALTDGMASINYDIKAFLRELALSDAYQRGFEFPNELTPYVTAAESLQDSTRQGIERQKQTLAATQEKLDTLTTALRESEKKEAELRATKLTAEQSAASASKAFADMTAAMQKQETEYDGQLAVSTKLATAASTATEVATATPEDAELKKAAEVLTAKSAERMKQVATLKAALDKTSQSVAAAQAASDKAKQTLQQAVAAWTPVNQDVVAKRTAVAEQEADVATQQQSLIAQQHQLRQIEKVLAVRDAQQAVGTAQQQIQQAQAAVVQADQTIASAVAAVASEMKLLEQASAATRQATDSLNKLKTQQAEKQSATKLLEDSLAQTKQAQAKLADQQIVGDAIERLTSAIATAKQESEAVAKTIAEQQTTVTEAQKKQTALQNSVAAKKVMEEQARAARAKAQQEVIASGERQATANAALEMAEGELAEMWSKQLVISMVAPLTNEQLAWSVFQATGIVDTQRTAAEAELKKKQAAAKEPQEFSEAEQKAQLEQLLTTKMAGNVAKFTKLFAPSSGQPQHDFFATVDQALFVANSADIQNWTKPSGGNLTERLAKVDDAKVLAEELYLSILTRMPNEEEVKDVTEYLQTRAADKPKAVQEMVWALIASAEFRFQR